MIHGRKNKRIITNQHNEKRKKHSIPIQRLLCFFSIIVFCFWILSLLKLEHHTSEVFELNPNNFLRNHHNYDHDDGHSHELNKKQQQNRGNQKQLASTTKQLPPMLTMYGKHRYQPAFESLPKWLQDYFTWHREQTLAVSIASKSSPSSSSSSKPDTKYAVITCLPEDDCGGLSDRLRPLPFFLFVGKHTNRVVCIYWKKGFGLEDYLQPVHLDDNNDSDIGIEWRCPEEVNQYYDLTKMTKRHKKVRMFKFGFCHKMKDPFTPCVEKDIKRMNDEFDGKYVSIQLTSRHPETINNANLLVQRHSYGGDYSKYSDRNNLLMPNLQYWQYPEMIGDIFRVMFEPIPLLTQRVNATMTNLGLVENEFVSTHVRARYPTGRLLQIVGNLKFDKDGGLGFDGKVKVYLITIIRNALECAQLLTPKPGFKIFLVSDHNEATNYAISNDFNVWNSGHKVNVRPVGVNRLEESLHMEGHHESNVADFYPIFEDLLIMGGSKCVSHGIGSFGSFGAGLIGNRCKSIHRKHDGKIISCPNDRTALDPVVINATEMIFGEKPGGEGKLIYDENRYFKISK